MLTDVNRFRWFLNTLDLLVLLLHPKAKENLMIPLCKKRTKVRLQGLYRSCTSEIKRLKWRQLRICATRVSKVFVNSLCALMLSHGIKQQKVMI